MTVEFRAEAPMEVPRLIQTAVADCHGIEVSEIERPLQRVVDVDSLLSLWWPQGRFSYDANGTVEFDYYNCRITIKSDGLVRATLQPETDHITG